MTKRVVMLLLGAWTLLAQNLPPKPEEQTLRLVQKLSEEVRALNVELTALRLMIQEARIRDLDQLLAVTAARQRQLEQQDSTLREDLADADNQLARGGQSPEERGALEEMRSSFLTESPRETRQELIALRQRETDLRKQVDQERAHLVALQQRLQALTRGASQAN